MNDDAQALVDATAAVSDAACVDHDAECVEVPAASPRVARRSWWRVGVVLVGLVAYATASQMATNEIVVKPGDTLTKIASDYRVSVDAIVAYNDLPNPNLIVAGRTLLIPSAAGETTHQVRMGDTLIRLAAVYGSTPAAIVERNHLADPNLIRIGQLLVIPRPNAAPAVVAPPVTTAPPTAAAPAPAPAAAPAVVLAPPAVAADAAPPTTAAPTTTATPATTTVPAAPTSSGLLPTIPRATAGGGLVSTMWVVQPGDTVASIAARFGLPARRLASANAIAESDPLLPGQRIYIPQG